VIVDDADDDLVIETGSDKATSFGLVATRVNLERFDPVNGVISWKVVCVGMGLLSARTLMFKGYKGARKLLC